MTEGATSAGMPTLRTDAVRSNGVTLVELRLSAERATRVTLAIDCEAPVWPPRSSDAATACVDDGVTLDLAPGVRGFGFATSTPPASVNVELDGAEPLEDSLPTGIEGWLEDVAERVARAERAAGADDLPAATDAVAAAGGLAALDRLAADLARDRRLMARFTFVPDSLRERAETVELPVEQLTTVAGPAEGS